MWNHYVIYMIVILLSFFGVLVAIQMKMRRPNGQFILHNNGAEAIKLL